MCLGNLAMAKAKKPARCPTVAEIKAGGLELVTRLKAEVIAAIGYEYGAGHLSTYNSKSQWAFAILIPNGQAVY